jgi:hypothetical protein
MHTCSDESAEDESSSCRCVSTFKFTFEATCRAEDMH